MSMVEQCASGVSIAIKVVPNASRNEIVGAIGDRLKVRVTSPPEDGKANKAVCQLLATALGFHQKLLSVTSGKTNPQKTNHIEGAEQAAVLSALHL